MRGHQPSSPLPWRVNPARTLNSPWADFDSCRVAGRLKCEAMVFSVFNKLKYMVPSIPHGGYPAFKSAPLARQSAH
jgi:hypothetical protein